MRNDWSGPIENTFEQSLRQQSIAGAILSTAINREFTLCFDFPLIERKIEAQKRERTFHVRESTAEEDEAQTGTARGDHQRA
jgi:hypothetical protein